MVSGVPEKTPTLKYPKSVAFIISNEFCERFNFYGMRTILALYATRRLAYSQDDATVLIHSFTSLAYFFPLIGAIVADSWLGRFKTIFYLSIVYAIGSMVIALGAIPTLSIPAPEATIIGLLLIAVGSGGIKPCVSAFGGDQFKLPEQEEFLAKFFSLFYLAINAGSLLSTTLTPYFREMHCFGETSCFSLAFGVPGFLMVAAIFIFALGRPFYTMREPSGNMLVSAAKCIWHALKTRSKERLVKPRYHWLDYAEQKYGKQLVYDVKCVLKILVLYIPVPIFWALFDQQGSRWTFQAEQMNGYVTENFSIKPEQMQVLNPLIVVFFIPVFSYVLYPVLERIGVRTPLQKMTVGMALSSLAFVVSGILELKLQQTYAVVPRHGEGQLRLFNGQMCGYRFDTDLPQHSHFTLEPNAQWTAKHITLRPNENVSLFRYKVSIIDGDTHNCQLKSSKGVFEVRSAEAQSYFLTSTGDFVPYLDSAEKSKSTLPLVRILVTADYFDSAANMNDLGVISRKINFQNAQNLNDGTEITFKSGIEKSHEIDPGTYLVWIDGTQVGAVHLQQGGSYTFVVNQMSANHYSAHIHTLIEPNSIHIMWQLPQYIIMTLGEIVFSVTGLEFSFTQAPASMKSVLQALWLLTVAVGNLLVVIIAKLKVSDSHAVEFFFFAALMAANVCLFIYLAMKYKYRNENENNFDENAHRTGVIVNMNGNTDHALNQTYTTTNAHGPTVAAIAAGITNSHLPQSTVGNVSGQKSDTSPKCLKQRATNGKNGVDNYGYTDV